ncbi:type II toxin-antitoxin system VapC family toxin [Roseimarinus sediminis]|uniref:type II toxin-antitoxin system VapC family toxin n=1 Tax=Roseimarinus sediminis TaxID=1610899 RepID=UPI003D1FF944
MDKVLVDTNIVVDLLTKRHEFYAPASKLFTFADNKKVQLSVSSLTFANIYYLLSRDLDSKTAKEILRKFKLLVKVLPIDDKIIDLSLNSDFKDFEDAIQYFSAIENKQDIIITRNLKDFKLSKLPVMTADHYLKMIK